MTATHASSRATAAAVVSPVTATLVVASGRWQGGFELLRPQAINYQINAASHVTPAWEAGGGGLRHFFPLS